MAPYFLTYLKCIFFVIIIYFMNLPFLKLNWYSSVLWMHWRTRNVSWSTTSFEKTFTTWLKYLSIKLWCWYITNTLHSILNFRTQIFHFVFYDRTHTFSFTLFKHFYQIPIFLFLPLVYTRPALSLLNCHM